MFPERARGTLDPAGITPAAATDVPALLTLTAFPRMSGLADRSSEPVAQGEGLLYASRDADAAFEDTKGTRSCRGAAM